MRLSFGLIFILMVSACSSDQRTKYGSYKKKNNGGYTHQKITDDLQMVTFRANSYTKKSTAELFARIRSLEICRDQEKQYSHILGVIDRSDSREITRSTSNVYGFPSYYYGYSPFYHRYSGIGFSAGLNTVTSNTWNETLVFPHYDLLFKCVDQVFEPEVIMREVSADEMKHLVKDLKGALQVEKVMDGSPNQQLKTGDILLKAGGERITQNWQLLALFNQSKTEVPVEILREGERIKFIMKAAPVTEQVAQSQQESLKAACKSKEIKERALCR